MDSGAAAEIGKPAEAANRLAAPFYTDEQRWFQGIVQASAEGIWIVDTNRITQFLNPRMLEILGYDGEEVVGRPSLDFFHPDDRERAVQGFKQRKLHPEDTGAREYRIVRKDGTEVWLSLKGSALYDSAGSVSSIVVMCTDVTQRRRADERIRELNAELTRKVAELETLLSVVPVGIAFSHDLECLTCTLNPEAQRLHSVDASVNASKTGPDADELPFRIFQNGIEVPGEQLPLQIAARGGEVHDAEYEVAYNDGRSIEILCSSRPMRDSEGNLLGGVAVLLDISERKRAETALRRANAALEQFAYAAAHDLQEPVRNVILYTQLLEKLYKDKLDIQAQRIMKVTVESSQRLKNLIGDLLSYTRIAMGEQSPTHAESDANVVLREVIANLHAMIESAQAHVSYDDLPAVSVHHGQLVQLFQNFVSNSIKYRGPDCPRVHVSAQRQGRMCTFSVADNGQGIPPEHQQGIFRIFKRLHGRDVPGNGIGLALCERIVTFYGGRIWVESEAGHGATFYFTLPVA